jgi:hypothetical protein
MLKHNNNLNQNDIINKQDARAALIEARRKRIEEARQEMVREEEKINQEIIDRNNDRDKDNGDGFVGRVLSMSTGTSLFMSSLTAIVEGMDKAGVSSMEEAEASLKRIDKSATDEDIEDLLKLLSEKVVAFDQLMLDRNIENYESNIRLEEERIAQEQEKENLEMLKNTIIIVFSFLISIFAKQNRTVGISSNTNNLFVKNQEVQTFSGCKDFFFLFLYNSFLEFVNIFLVGFSYIIYCSII